MTRHVHICPDLEALSTAAAVRAVRMMRSAPPDGAFRLVLSGGSTPRVFHEKLALRYGRAIPWERIHLFWGDERLVPHDHPESNYGMAVETLIRHVPIPPANVHAFCEADGPSYSETDVHPYSEAKVPPYSEADEMERQMRGLFGDEPETTFDLTILGLGDDGHTASLFPASPALAESHRWIVPAEAPPDAPIRERLTMTFPLINRSREVFFLVSGSKKRLPLRAILEEKAEAAAYPASLVRAAEAVHWFVDEAAYG